ncbi:MAG: ATP-binding protein [Candidatus Cryptobacteroides sp.]
METTFTYDRKVSGKSFVGRKAELEILEQAIRDGKNVAIYESAKSGKGSLLKHCLLSLSIKGFKYQAFELSLLNIRSEEDFLKKFAALFNFSYDSSQTPDDGLTLGLLSIAQTKAAITGQRVIVILSEFQNIYKVNGGEKILKLMEKVAQDKNVTWVWTGSQVNGMKEIFEKRKFFFKNYIRIKLQPISVKEAENFLIKGFLVSGKVIEAQQADYVYEILQGNIYYLQHFAAICDGLSRGFITEAVVEESILSLLSIHEARFISTIYDLTSFQINLLKAVLDGENRFSSSEVIKKYSLNSSANVKRLKEALCKKEIITFDDKDKARLLDPLFEYWLRKYYFI